jgi:hypothetical protein
MPQEQKTRNLAITELYSSSSLSSTEIGRKFGISRQRVVEIALKYGARRRKTRDYGAIPARAEWIFQIIIDYKEQHDGVAPSYREIREKTGFSNSVIFKAFIYLEESGQIRRVETKNSRSIMVVGGKWMYKGEYHEDE